MLLRLVGGALLLAASFLFSRELGRADAVGIKRLEGLYLLFARVRAEIAGFRTPLREIYARFENTALADSGFLSLLREKGMAAALKETETVLALDAETHRALTAAAERLGEGYAGELLARCDAALAVLQKNLEEQQRELPRKSRVRTGLFCTGGLMLVLLLI